MYSNIKIITIITRIPLYLTITKKYFTFNEHCYLDEIARILVVDEGKDSVVVIRDDHIEQAADR